IFTGIVFLKSIGRKFMSPYFPAVSLSSTFLRQPAGFLYGGKCIMESKGCCPAISAIAVTISAKVLDSLRGL
ncbi:MAG: hypothetical protein IIZ18_05315, partial [Ruminococcus sp.]|nr:hypothetical protein [Ruminococcus sp.]